MFTKLIGRKSDPTVWEKIPWHDPDFSQRMLAEHLSQSHDLASRRFQIIDEQVAWIHHKVLNQQSAHILDLGCGPGFYVHRLSQLGHTCTGIDFSPASLDYARQHHPTSKYIAGDVREVEYGQDYDFVSMIYGELNAFAPQDAQAIINKAYSALKVGGKLLLEVHPYATIYRIGHEAPSWHTAEKGLFSDEAYLCLVESSFELDHAISRYYVFAADSGEMRCYTAMHSAYTDDEYRNMLGKFKRVLFYPSLTGKAEAADLFVILAEK